MKAPVAGMGAGLVRSYDGSVRRWFLFVPSLLVVLIYWQVLNHVYVAYDDALYTYDNPIVIRGLTWDGIWWSLNDIRVSNYHPLTWWSHMLDFELLGNAPGVFALENATLHSLNTFLVVLILARMLNSTLLGVIGGMLFAVHPVLVESVAWISQRKTVLSSFFAFACVLCYLLSIDMREDVRRRVWYSLALGLFVMSLLAKGMFVTMPVILLIAAMMSRTERIPERFGGWFRGSEFSNLYKGILPFLLVALFFSFVTYWAQKKGGAVSTLESVSFLCRLQTMLVGFSAYLWNFVFPHKLSILYPFRYDVPFLELAFRLLALSLVTIAMYLVRFRVGLRPFLGWLFFLLTMLPVSGIVQIGSHQYADRYMYGPIVGLIASVVYLIDWVWKTISSSRMRSLLLYFFAVIIMLLSISCYFQVGFWRNGVILSTISRDNIVEKGKLSEFVGNSFLAYRDFENARQFFVEALESKPYAWKIYEGLAWCEYGLGNVKRAIELQENFVAGSWDSGKGLARLIVYYLEDNRKDDALAALARARSLSDRLGVNELALLELIEEDLRDNSGVSGMEHQESSGPFF